MNLNFKYELPGFFGLRTNNEKLWKGDLFMNKVMDRNDDDD